MATRLLSERECEVLHLVAEGMPNLTIARTLFISPSAVEKHLTNVVTRLGATTSVEEVAGARRSGILD